MPKHITLADFVILMFLFSVFLAGVYNVALDIKEKGMKMKKSLKTRFTAKVVKA